MQQTCKACGRPDKFDFTVPDEIWQRVVPEHLQKRVVCLGCFDDFAHQRGVDYAKDIRVLYFAGGRASLVFQVQSAAP